jgi:hypothetical protein
MKGAKCLTFTGVLLGLLGAVPGGALASGPVKITKCQTITISGSYAVENNLTATGDCLVIAADFVTIDLAGFVLMGNRSGAGVVDPFPPAAHRGVVVRNGTVTNFGVGISLGDGSRVEGVQAISNTSVGIFIAGGVVTGNIVMNNGAEGISAGTAEISPGVKKGAVVTGNFANANAISGITADGVVTGNSASGNGLVGGVAGFGAVTGNFANGNTGNGIGINQGSTVTGNVAKANTGDGLKVICPSNLIGNTATFNGMNLDEDLSSGVLCNDSNNVAP